MKYAGIILGVLVLGIGAYWLLGSPATEITNMPPKNDVIVAFGDSLVAGEGAVAAGGFVSLLEARTGKEIVNLGVPGDTTRSGRARLEEARAYDPGIVIVLLGGNDALRRIPIEETATNLSSIIEAFQSDGAVVLLVGVRGGLLGDPYEDMYAELAGAHGTAFVPNVLQGILLRPELTADQIHPNDDGYAIVADRVLSQLSPLLEEVN